MIEMKADLIFAPRYLGRICAAFDDCRYYDRIAGAAWLRGDDELVADSNVRVVREPLVDRDCSMDWILEEQCEGEES